MSTPHSFDQNQFPQGQPFQVAPVEQPKKKKKWPWIVGIVGALVVFGAASGGDSDDTTTDTVEAVGVADPVAVEAEAEADAPAEQPTDLQIGETTELGGMQVTVNSARFATDFFGNTYVCVDTSLTNNSDKQKSFAPYDFELEKPNGVVADPAIHGLDVNTLEYAELNPGGTTDGTVCFDGADPGEYKVNYEGGLFDMPVSWNVTL
ncbi:DUF4352 domain-containing protein [Corynebacterium sp.]|uniref:DUF4352 domain-containing protein n=1 Tax=Corynebacterium sp. TaxID=1720 RepID=UPI0026DEB96C|nr:DUF4352 domain-containing protein [Corynebacterium sp.]MDO5512130.1 DUF4352 domain-containing protein [Corynebacterium sp.]